MAPDEETVAPRGGIAHALQWFSFESAQPNGILQSFRVTRFNWIDSRRMLVWCTQENPIRLGK